MSISITYEIEREGSDGEMQTISVEATGTFHRGELEDWDTDLDEKYTLTADEEAAILAKLQEARDDDFDEDKADERRRGE